MQDIIEHIKIASNESSRHKGEEIYQNRQRLQFVDFDANKLTIKVKGTGKGIWYDVVISMSDEGGFRSSCTCPYDWGGICKHQVASFLYLIDYLERNPAAMKNGKTGAQALYKQSSISIDIERFQEEQILQFISKYLYLEARQLARSKQFLLQRLTNQEIHAELTSKSLKLQFRKEGATIHTHCSCGQETTDPICVHKAGALLQICNEDGEFAFEQLKDWEEEKNQLLATYGYTTKEPGINDKFAFHFKGGQLLIKLKDPSILPIKEEQMQERFKFLKPLQKRSRLTTLQRLTDDDDRSMGVAYLVSFDLENTLQPMRITPFKGKLAKDGARFTSHLAPLEGQDLSFMSCIDEADRQIIAAIQDLSEASLMRMMERRGLTNYAWAKAEQTPAFADALGSVYQYTHSQLLRIFKLLQGKWLFMSQDDTLRIYTLVPIALAERPVSPSFLLKELENDMVLQLSLMAGQETIDPSHYQMLSPFALLANGLLYITRTPEDHPAIQLAFQQPIMRIRQAGKEGFLKRLLLPLMKRYPVELQMELRLQEVDGIEPEAKLFLDEQEGFLVLTPLFEYEGKQVSPFESHDIVYEDEDDIFVRIRRDYDYEEEMLQLLLQSHERFGQEGNSLFLNPSDVLENNWFFEVFDFLKEKGYEIYGFNLLKSFRYSPHKPETIFNITSGIDWFDCEIIIKFGEQVVSLKDVRKAVLNRERYVKLADGTLGILPEEWIQRYGAILKLGQIGKDGMRLSKVHFSVIDEMYEDISNEEVLREIAYKKRRLREFEKIQEVGVPQEITANLRHYQVAGLNWMHFLHEFGWGGCLADDMGLGKTLQALTFLQSIKNKGKSMLSLVVAPTSLMFNWSKEIEKFAPELKFMVHHGINRSEDIREFYNYDVVLTTYGIVVRDIEKMRRIKFDYVVLDESQAIKNVTSKRYKAVSLLSANNRLALTGTPVENNTLELYAQMQFLNPGILGSQEFFKMEYANPIDKKGEMSRVEELKKLVFPFILRRTKEQVAKDLPDKSETVLYCEMGPKQRKVYDAFKNYYRDRIMDMIEEQGIERSGIFILEGLLKLRQICDSPALLKDRNDYNTDESVKLNELSSQVQEVVGAHKVLIFSQFVEMLSLIRKQLERKGIEYTYLDGQTRNREGVVEEFQTNPAKRVFLISLKAGGVGLNLTAADYVYLVDPWWNPAVEQQAIDRTHRIGQTQKVFAYKMICKDTVEEKILQLQQKKRELVSDIISPEQGFIKNLTKDDVVALFS